MANGTVSHTKLKLEADGMAFQAKLTSAADKLAFHVHPCIAIKPWRGHLQICHMPARQLLWREWAFWTMPASECWESCGHLILPRGAGPPCFGGEGASQQTSQFSVLWRLHLCCLVFVYFAMYILFWFMSCLCPCLVTGCLPSVS